MMSFVKRKINLPTHQNTVLNLLKSKDLEACISAENLIWRAQKHAQDLVDSAREEAAKIRQQAQDEVAQQALEVRLKVEQAVWQECNALLGELNTEKEVLWNNIEQSATLVLNEALRKFMDDVSTNEKAYSLVRQLVKVHRQPKKGVLACSGELLESILNALDRHSIMHWEVVADPTLLEGELFLSTEQGGFRCSWDSIREGLMSCSMTDE